MNGDIASVINRVPVDGSRGSENAWCANRSVNSSTRIDQWLWKSALRDSEDPFDGRRYLREAWQPVCPRNGQTSTGRDSSAIIMACGGGGRGAQIDRHNWFNFCANFHGYIGKAGNLVEISSKYRSRPRQFLLFFFSFLFFFI